MLLQLISSTGGIFSNVFNKMQLDFSNDLHIKTVVINTESTLEIASIMSPKISTLKISGMKLTISDLCMFSSNTSLPSLKLVQISDASLENFDQHQFCTKCDHSHDFDRNLEVNIYVIEKHIGPLTKNRSNRVK